MQKRLATFTAVCIMLIAAFTLQIGRNNSASASVMSADNNTTARATTLKLGVSKASSYLNIRKKASTQSKVVGRLYRGTVAYYQSSSSDWVKVTSQGVEGYVSKQYLATGAEAKKLLIQYANPKAKVTATSLRVRKSNSTKSDILGLVTKGTKLPVISQGKNWTKVRYKKKTAYVSNDYVKLIFSYEYAVSMEEEKENIDDELAASDDVQDNNQNTEDAAPVTTGDKIAEYAVKFVGNPYVWGGTSLTKGADCSGFIQSVYKKFDISIPRTSRQQAVAGTKVSVAKIKKGDVISYARNGVVNHVALYIGNGRVVHASNPRDGIKISKFDYRSIHSVRRFV